MPAPLSIVIPTLNAEQSLPGCAAALIEGVEAGLICELVISDGGSDDATRAVAEDLGALWVTGEASRGGQLRRGCAAAKGEWLLILHADTQLQPGWSDVVARHLGQEKAGYFCLRFASGGIPARLVAGWANQRARFFGLPYGDQGLLISRALYEEIGGFQDMPLMEDVAMARALRGRMLPLNAEAVTSAEKYERQGWIRRGGRNLWTLMRYFAGVSPEELAKAYRRN